MEDEPLAQASPVLELVFEPVVPTTKPQGMSTGQRMTTGASHDGPREDGAVRDEL